MIRVYAILVIGLACLNGCNRTVEGYCCTDPECADTAQGVVECDNPATPFCDNTGEYPASDGVGRRCIADPLSSQCDGPQDCTNVERPFCVDNMCVECTDSGECEAAAPVCDPDSHLCGTCSDSNDCADQAGTTQCFVDTGACVECLIADDCAAATAPVCDDTDHACRGCEQDDECASDACDAGTGACLDELDVIYLDPTGGGAVCTRALPCATFAAGLAVVGGTRRTIKLASGSYSERVTIADKTVSIRGAGADLSALTAGQLIDITGSADVTIDGLRIHDGLGASGDGVRCTDNAVSPTVTLTRVTLDANTGKGINATNCDLSITGSKLSANVAGGVSISGGTFSIINNWITGNGGGATVFGGVQLANITAAGTHVLDFNTLYNNNANDTFPAGVNCPTVSTPITMSNNIVFMNESTNQVGGANCTFTYSNIGPAAQAGTGNINMAPTFVNAGTGDFHLMATSPGHDAADATATTAVDIDGDDRPQGGGPDMGGDEIVE